MIYLDNAATNFVKPNLVKKSVNDALNLYTANPGRSGHKASLLVAEQIFEVREKVKEFFGAENYEVFFTKNCTEALNLAIFGTLKTGDHVIATCYEHNSVLRPLEKLKEIGVEVDIVSGDLCCIENQIEKAIKENTRMVITTAVSNVTGESVNIEAVSNLCKEHNLIYLVDGAQASGHIKIELEKMDIDMFAFAGHKGLLSVAGVGGLIVKNMNQLKPILFGGTGTNSFDLVQHNETIEDFESGTLPTIPILSLGAGIDFLKQNFEKVIKYEQNLSKYTYFELKKLKFLKIYSKDNANNVISFNVGEMPSQEVANMLNEDFNICVRGGLHCAPLTHKKLGTLNQGAVRVSIDFSNTKEEIDYLIHALKKINSK